MCSVHLIYTVIAALLFRLVSSQNNTFSVCYSFGIDFVDGGTYFINSASNEIFTVVSQFEGCNDDIAHILLILPSGDELFCSDVSTTPDDTSQLTTCPILKSQMVSGAYIIELFGNNGDSIYAFARERDIALDVGPQATTTITATATYNITITPTLTVTEFTTIDITTTIQPNCTVTVPSVTGLITVTPSAVLSTSTRLFTKYNYIWTRTQCFETSTVTASCIVPSVPLLLDKWATYTPTKVHPAALFAATPTSYDTVHRKNRAVDAAYASHRIVVSPHESAGKAEAAARKLDVRGPDPPTITVTAAQPINTTITLSAAPSTFTVVNAITIVHTSSLPPVTVLSGAVTSTTTLPPQTNTRYAFSWTAAVVTRTIDARWTRTVTVTPSEVSSTCRAKGGYLGTGRW